MVSTAPIKYCRPINLITKKINEVYPTQTLDLENTSQRIRGKIIND